MNSQKRRLGPDSRLLVLRSNAAVTIFRIASGGFAAPPVQVVLCTCKSVQELLLRFDVDSSCFAVILDEDKVVCTPRGRRALRYGVNVVDNELFESSAHTRRLERYAKRGFAIGVPGYLPELVSTRLLSAEYAHFKAYDLLLRLKPLSQCAEELSIPNRNQTAHVKIGGKQDATSVRGFERIVVLDRCTIRHLEVPNLTFCEHHRKVSAEPANDTGCVVPIVLGGGAYKLLWNAIATEPEISESDCDDIVEDYTATPLAAVYNLLEKKFNSEIDNEVPDDEGTWPPFQGQCDARPVAERLVEPSLLSTTV